MKSKAELVGAEPEQHLQRTIGELEERIRLQQNEITLLNDINVQTGELLAQQSPEIVEQLRRENASIRDELQRNGNELVKRVEDIGRLTQQIKTQEDVIQSLEASLVNSNLAIQNLKQEIEELNSKLRTRVSKTKSIVIS